MKKWMIVFAVAGLLAWGTGCEKEEHTEIYYGEEEAHEPGGSSQSQSHYSASNVGGTWKGKAGTAQGSTTLRLTQSGNSLSGSWTWGAGDTRSCKGSKNGNRVVLKDQRSDGDTWTWKSGGANGLKMDAYFCIVEEQGWHYFQRVRLDISKDGLIVKAEALGGRREIEA